MLSLCVVSPVWPGPREGRSQALKVEKTRSGAHNTARCIRCHVRMSYHWPWAARPLLGLAAGSSQVLGTLAFFRSRGQSPPSPLAPGLCFPHEALFLTYWEATPSFKLRYYFNWVAFIRALATKSEGMACSAWPSFLVCLVSLLKRE